MRGSDGTCRYLEFQNLVPTGKVLSTEGSALDFRKTRTIGATKFNFCFTDLVRDANGVAWAELGNPANGYSVKYVPIEYSERAGSSKFHWWKDTKRYLTQVVRMVLSYSPLRVFMPLALALLVIGLGKLGYDAIRYDLRVTTNTLLILFAAFQLFAIGLLADLFVRLSKPSTVVDPASR